jgi:hypothetical protein
MIVVDKMTTTAAATTARGNPMVHFRPPTGRSTSLLAVAKQPRATDNIDQTQGRSVNTETPQPLRWSKYPITFSRKDHWVHILDPGTYPLVVNPIVDGAFLPKTLIDGGSSLNIIFKETLRKMDLNFNKMTACDEPFYGLVPDNVVYPIGCVCLPVTFDTKENFRTEYLMF